MNGPPVTLSVQRIVRAAPEDIFTAITDPTRHAQMDATGVLRGALPREPLREVGQRFVERLAFSTDEEHECTGEVTRFVRGQSLECRSPSSGPQESGWRLRIDLDQLDELNSRVTLHFWWLDTVVEPRHAERRFSSDHLAVILDGIADAVE
ncbi:MAG: hypothetical protein ABI746_07965 [Dermatophilaceae bacterium]